MQGVGAASVFASTRPTSASASFFGASVLGAWLGAGIVARWSKRKVQLGMGMALLAAAVFFTMQNLKLFPGGSDALGVRGLALVAAVAGNFLLGALMSLGIGLYAPCMVLISLLGMNATTAFPIMMGSCAFLMPVGSLRFIRERAYSLKAALGLAIGGIPGVLIAAYIVKSLNLVTVRWLVIVVVVYTAVTMLHAAFKSQGASSAAEAIVVLAKGIAKARARRITRVSFIGGLLVFRFPRTRSVRDGGR